MTGFCPRCTAESEFVVEAMSNIIRLNETAPKDQWIVMSNQGTDCFLELLILSADALHQTEYQEARVLSEGPEGHQRHRTGNCRLRSG